MKIKNLYVAETIYLPTPTIVKKPSFIKIILAACIGAEIVTYKEAITNTKLKICPDNLQPLYNYINVEYYGKDISERRLKKLIFRKKEENIKRKIGF